MHKSKYFVIQTGEKNAFLDLKDYDFNKTKQKNTKKNELVNMNNNPSRIELEICGSQIGLFKH